MSHRWNKFLVVVGLVINLLWDQISKLNLNLVWILKNSKLGSVNVNWSLFVIKNQMGTYHGLLILWASRPWGIGERQLDNFYPDVINLSSHDENTNYNDSNGLRNRYITSPNSKLIVLILKND